MKYIVDARDWTPALQQKYGDACSIHELTDEQIVESALEFGIIAVIDLQNHSGYYQRFINAGAVRLLNFENE